MNTSYLHAKCRSGPPRRSAIAVLTLFCVAMFFACVAAEGIVLPRQGIAGEAEMNHKQESPVSLQIVWVDHIAKFDPKGGRLKQRFDLWNVHIGVAVRHESEDLDPLLSTSISIRCGWRPRQAWQLQRLGSDTPVSITLAPELSDRYEVPFQMKPGRLNYTHIFENDDGSFTTLGKTSLTFMDKPKLPGVYQLRFIEDGDWSERFTPANHDWFTFVLSRDQEPEDSHIKDRIPWSSLLEE